MNLKQHLDIWTQERLLTEKQRQAIWAFEQAHQNQNFGIGLLFLAAFCFFLSGVFFVSEYWVFLSDFAKIGSGLLGLLMALLLTAFAKVKHKEKLFDVSLMLVCLCVGTCVWLVTDMYHLPTTHGESLLVGTGLSLPAVLLTQRKLLPLVWMFLFLCGVISWIQFDTLLALFESQPVGCVFLSCIVLLCLMLAARHSEHSFMRAMSDWSLILYYLILPLGEDAVSSIVGGFLMTCAGLILLAGYAFYARRQSLFYGTLFLIALRFVILLFQTIQHPLFMAMGLILVALGLYFIVIGHKKWTRFQRFLSHHQKS